MRILLIHPSIGEHFYQDVMHPPLGLVSIAAVLRQKGHEVKILDENLNRNQPGVLLKDVADFNPEVVGVSCTTANMRNSVAVAKSVKELNPDIKTIFGGVHPQSILIKRLNWLWLIMLFLVKVS